MLLPILLDVSLYTRLIFYRLSVIKVPNIVLDGGRSRRSVLLTARHLIRGEAARLLPQSPMVPAPSRMEPSQPRSKSQIPSLSSFGVVSVPGEVVMMSFASIEMSSISGNTYFFVLFIMLLLSRIRNLRNRSNRIPRRIHPDQRVSRT